jgi:hypothetical protein
MITLRTIELENGRISPADYAILQQWIAAQHGTPPPITILPTLGVIAFQGQTPIATAFAYLDATGSGVAFIEWIFSNPGAPAFLAGRAVGACIDFLEQQCTKLNYGTLFIATANNRLAQHLPKLGFLHTESGIHLHQKTLVTS